MARLYHKAYRRGGGRKGGFKKASPDPMAASAYTCSGLTTATRPDYLASFTDDQCGTTLKRITDATEFGSAARHWISYTKVPAEVGGRHGTYVAIASRYPPWLMSGPEQAAPYDFIGGGAGTDQDPYPSQITDGRIYRSVTDGRFVYHQQPAGLRTLIHNFSLDTPSYPYLRLTQGEGVPSNDENRWAICGKTAASASSGEWHVLVYEVSSDTVLWTYDLNITNSLGTSGACNHVKMSPSGLYVVMSFSATVNGYGDGYHSFRVSDGAYIGQLSNNQNHGDVGYLEDGVTEVWFGQNDGGDITYRVIDCSAAAVILVTDWLTDSGQGYWGSMRCLDRPGYAYLGSTDFNSGSYSPPAKYDDTVFAIRLATGEIEPWCRGYSSGLETGGVSRYFVPSRDGKRLYVTLPNPLREPSPPADTKQETYVVTYDPS
jgi:hypothetical protein